MDHNMDPTNSMFDQLSSPIDESFGFTPFDADAFANDPMSSGLSSSSAGGSPLFAQQTFPPVGFPAGFQAADHYPSPRDGEGISPQSEMAGMVVVNQYSSPSMMPGQLPSHGRTNQGSISSLASSATAVSRTDGHVEIKEELSPLSMNSPAVEAVALAAPDAAASAVAPAATTPVKAPAKRKRENRYKNAPPAVLSRRRAQNRASQRAYRERKDQRIRDLEEQISNMGAENENYKASFGTMHSYMMAMRMNFARLGHPVPPLPIIFGAPPMAGPPMPMPNPAMAGPMVPGNQQMEPSMFHQAPPNFMPMQGMAPQGMAPPPPQPPTGYPPM
ncbi:hypothetical protein SBRCBS47491_006303 [Sporothrix bragantina]|uniref:BZIP domain-containing protein n=1 Tax=Sporothrix bragantina TaxID=671064 RepID=A0ABP0C3U3_9PEZI